MSTASIKSRIALPSFLFTALLAACSTPMPVPTSVPVPAKTVNTTSSLPPPLANDESGEAVRDQFAKAVGAIKNGEDELAINLFTNLTRQYPRLASPYTNLGILFYRREHLAEAEAALKNALQRDEMDYVAANYLGMTYRALGRFNDARSAYEQALTDKPDYANAHLNLAILYDLYLGDLAKALEQYQQYRQLVGDSNPQLAGWLADLAQRMKSSEGTIKP